MRFDRILLMGSGKVATECVRYLCKDLQIRILEVIETSDSQFSMLGRTCMRFGVPYRRMCCWKEITGLLREISEEKRLLIISANNRYLFPAGLCEQQNIEIINFHYSYLPKYRGMNIPTWVIYNKEPFTGVTWHFVTGEVDRGRIIAQKKITLHDDITAYEIVRDGMRIGAELFRDFAVQLLEQGIDGKEILTEEYIYLDKHLPQEGILNIHSSVPDIYRLLRSFDYGRAETLRALEVNLEGKKYFVESYGLADAQDLNSRIICDGNELVITESGKQLRIRLRSGTEDHG